MLQEILIGEWFAPSRIYWISSDWFLQTIFPSPLSDSHFQIDVASHAGFSFRFIERLRSKCREVFFFHESIGYQNPKLLLFGHRLSHRPAATRHSTKIQSDQHSVWNASRQDVECDRVDSIQRLDRQIWKSESASVSSVGLSWSLLHLLLESSLV